LAKRQSRTRLASEIGCWRDTYSFNTRGRHHFFHAGQVASTGISEAFDAFADSIVAQSVGDGARVLETARTKCIGVPLSSGGGSGSSSGSRCVSNTLIVGLVEPIVTYAFAVLAVRVCGVAWVVVIAIISMVSSSASFMEAPAVY